MEAVLGVGRASEARKQFVAHVRSRMRRVVRGHDRPYAIFEPFGARPGGDFNETEEFVLDNVAFCFAAKRERWRRASGSRTATSISTPSTSGWISTAISRRATPSGFRTASTRSSSLVSPRNKKLKELGTAPGLWIDSGGLPAWTVGGNPAVSACFSELGGKGGLCRASEPIRSMYTAAFRYLIRRYGVRLLKFDNLLTRCNNPSHDHLPGLPARRAGGSGPREATESGFSFRRETRADFSQESYGGWPIAAALDGDPKTGWSVDPLEGKPHLAVFEAEKPVGFPGGTMLEFVLQQGSPVDHNLGRLRLSAT